MAYADIWTHANDETFQGRCWAALWDVCNKVAAGDAGYPAAGMAAASADDDAAYAIRVLRDEARVTARQLAQQVLRNPTIAANPASAVDNDLAWQINNAAWAELRGIG
jgi:hypothetical protein